jgi:hypothetical protein
MQPPSLPLTAIGRYQVRAKLGSGAFGTVYHGYDPQLDRAVALKLLHPEALASPQTAERFQREARAAADTPPGARRPARGHLPEGHSQEAGGPICRRRRDGCGIAGEARRPGAA